MNLHKIIWVKTPKCAGTSIKATINHSELRRKIIIVLPNHFDEFVLKYPELWKNSYRFTIVRNPFDKFISSWKYLKLTNVHDLRWTIDNLPTREQHYKGWHHITRTQCDIIGNYNYDKIIRYEDLDKGISEIFQMVGSKEVLLPVLNWSDRKRDYRCYYDDYTKNKVAQLYTEDLERFNYKF